MIIQKTKVKNFIKWFYKQGFTTYSLNNQLKIKYKYSWKKFLDYVYFHTAFLDKNNPTMAERLWHIVHDSIEIPKCECGNNCKFYIHTRNYLTFCSRKCVYKSPIIRKKIESTSLKKYGTKSPSQSSVVKKKMQDTCLEKFGTCSSFESEIVKNKIKKTNMEKYGFENPFQSKEIQQKIKETNIEKYGVENPVKSKIIYEKMCATNMKKFGHRSATQNSAIAMKISTSLKKHYADPEQAKISNDKRVDTCLKIYNVEYVAQDPAIFEKQSKKSFLNKPYTLPSGKIIFIQGYENFALDILLKKYTEEQIIYKVKLINERVGKIHYYDSNNIRHIYFPDFYIPQINTIIEVKSLYTYTRELEQNKLKQQACIDKNLLFEFWIMDYHGNLSIIK